MVIRGNELMIWVSGSTLGFATSCKVDLKANTLSTSSKDSGKWTENQAVDLSWSVTSDNLYSVDGYKKLMDALISRKPLSIQFSTVSNADSDNGKPTTGDWTFNSDGYKGTAILTSVSATAQKGENATFSVEMTGTGALTPVTA